MIYNKLVLVGKFAVLTNEELVINFLRNTKKNYLLTYSDESNLNAMLNLVLQQT